MSQQLSDGQQETTIQTQAPNHPSSSQHVAAESTMSEANSDMKQAPSTGMNIESHAHRRRHEVITMALYFSLSLLAVIVALPWEVEFGDHATPVKDIFFTGVGLVMAHTFAFLLSTRFVEHGEFSGANLQLLWSQLIAGAAVTLAALTPFLIVNHNAGVVTSEVLLLGFIAVVGYFTARSMGLSRIRAVLYMSGVVLGTLGVLWVKNLTHF
jgi:cation transport ATPase